jgi:hypothetical protein
VLLVEGLCSTADVQLGVLTCAGVAGLIGKWAWLIIKHELDGGSCARGSLSVVHVSCLSCGAGWVAWREAWGF